MLCHRRQCISSHVMDDDEWRFPFRGHALEAWRNCPNRSCDPRALRDGYIGSARRVFVEVRGDARGWALTINWFARAIYLDAVLSKFLHHRMDSGLREGRQECLTPVLHRDS